MPEFSSAAQEAEFWRGRASHWRKAAKDAKEELDEFQVRVPQDPHAFWPPGPGSISQRYGSGSFPFPINVLSGLK